MGKKDWEIVLRFNATEEDAVAIISIVNRVLSSTDNIGVVLSENVATILEKRR